MRFARTGDFSDVISGTATTALPECYNVFRRYDPQRGWYVIAERVLVAADVAEGSGGVADHVSALAFALRSCGADVEVFWSGAVSTRLPGALRPLGFSVALGRRARRVRPDVLHAHTSSGGIAHLLAHPSTTCVTTSHGDERDLWAAERTWARSGGPKVKPWSLLLVPTLRLSLFASAVRSADGVVALHDGEGEKYRAERGALDAVAVVPNAARPDPPAAIPVPGRVVYVGSWIYRKGNHTLVEAFTALQERRPLVELVLVGPGQKALADFPLGARASVRALGFVDHTEVDAQLSSADVLVLPSLFEGMPLVVLDALSRGVPVVASDLPGTRAAVGAAGILVPPGDGAALADAIERLVDDRELRSQLSIRARAAMRSHTWDDVAASTSSLYEEAAGNRPRRALGRFGRLLGRHGRSGART